MNMEPTIEKIKEKVQGATDTVIENQNVGNSERIISGIAGIVLTLYGLKRKDTMLGKGLSIVGGMLISRATSGFCPVNKAVGRNSFAGALA
ncbi:DUF2892 domain-containing protein [Dyadobacter sp. CY326]|uniref:YgaP family membrane protein n=1 Tax=Dyadobacter sp. CY326 TaxID=2907300 RepID=UPI001F387078|nr:DUF2892 domain-containing protein [Dyadobacter sp. CY326]MCE7064912.1 DUF2892 domain-containing protein [Dyadobacter sp. CY326]